MIIYQANKHDELVVLVTLSRHGEEFQYNFEHNFDFVDIFIEAPSTFDFNSLLSGDTLGQTFRVVILPVDFINSSNLDLTNYNTVMEYVQ